MAEMFDVAVAGLGTMGCFACLELVKRGVKVVGLDRFAPPHGRGSHSGETRIFRTAYAEHPAYVPLAVRAGELWDRLGEERGKKLLERCGMLSMGPADGELIQGARASAGLHGLRLRVLEAAEIREEFPAFLAPEEYVGVFEDAAGWVDVDGAIGYALERAEQGGARILRDSPVMDWERDGDGLRVRSAAGEFLVGKLVIAAGAWTAELLEDLGLPLEVQRKVLVWVDPEMPELYMEGQFPVFAIADRFFYGFPNVGGRGVKVAIHWTGGGVVTDPEEGVAPVGEEDVAPVLEMAGKYLKGLGGKVVGAKTCLYTMTPDEHFVIDRHPEEERVCFAGGFSGHGFKFAPVVGEALADLAMEGRTKLPVGFLRRGRLAVVK